MAEPAQHVDEDGAVRSSCSDLVRLRASVEEWTKRATHAIRGFKRTDGSFWKDSVAAKDGESAKRPNITTTARAFAALLAADRASQDRRAPAAPWWAEMLDTFLGVPRLEANGDFHQIGDAGSKEIKTNDVNAFDIAHLTDFITAAQYLDRLHKSKREAVLSSLFVLPEGADPAALIATRLKAAVMESIATPLNKGQVLFEKGQPNSHHFFATLHVLRALHALGVEFDADFKKENIEEVVDGARLFAIEQCYYFQRGTTHKQDPVRLAFAGCIYAIYNVHIDKDLCLSIVESLAAAQQENGSWPATHPVLRSGQQPWHIASHEVALCLTWLYFQPRVPDAARPILVSMMRQHFLKAVIPTYVTTATVADRPMQGWQDDHTVSPDTAVGWATAIVAHFLANFSFVLNDWINRRVIEELGIEETSKQYLIDDTTAAQSLKWAHEKDAAVKLSNRAIWPDLPPHAWTRQTPDAVALAKRITDNWTDPSADALISKKLGAQILAPILNDPGQRPREDRCAGLLPGAPGTRKTSFVGELARIVAWPMVSPPASLIFAKGFELMEAQANEVFRRLSYLRGCVIFFDEFEEFFLTRDPPKTASEPDTPVKVAATAPVGAAREPMAAAGSYQSRTIAAFTTSAMLPRLQDLHDKDACLIFLATNYPEKIDEAIKRAGRFDFLIEIGHPGTPRLIEYLGTLSANSRRRVGMDRFTPDEQGAVIAAAKAALTAYPQAATNGNHEAPGKLKFKHLEDVLRALSASYALNPETPLPPIAENALRLTTALGDASGNPPDLLTLV